MFDNNSDEFLKTGVPQLPSWVPMGESQQPSMSPFVDALKKRLKTPMMKDGEAGMTAGKAAAEGSAPQSL